MITMSVYESKARLSELLDLVALGMEITITKNRQPVARLVPLLPMSEEKQPETSA